MRRPEETGQRSKVKGQKSQSRNLDTKGVGGYTVLDSSTFDLRLLTFLSNAGHPARRNLRLLEA
jgi:hypothetical protein